MGGKEEEERRESLWIWMIVTAFLWRAETNNLLNALCKIDVGRKERGHWGRMVGPSKEAQLRDLTMAAVAVPLKSPCGMSMVCIQRLGLLITSLSGSQ